MVELPLLPRQDLVGQRVALRLLDDRLPAVGPQRARRDHLVVLHALPRRSRRVVERVREAHAFERPLRDAVEELRRVEPERREDRRRDVDDVRVLAAHLAARRDALRPVHDQRVAHAALVQVALPAPQRRVARPRPAPRIVGERAHAAPVVEARQVLLDRRLDAVGELVLVERAVLAALRRRAVVGGQQDQRVVELAAAREEVDHPPDVVVGLLEEGRVDLHLPRVQAPRVRRKRVPRLDPRRPRRELRAGRHDGERELPREHLLAPAVPAQVELPAVALDPLRLDVVRRVPGAQAVVHEERLVGRDGAQVGQVLHRAVGEVGVEVVALLRPPRRLDVVVVVHQRGHPLVGLAGDETVVALEPARQRPARLRRAGRVLGGERQVPLADAQRGVALRAQHLGQEPVLARHHAVVAGKARGHLLDDADTVGVMVAPGEQARARRRADRRRVEVAVAQAARRQPVERRRADVGAVAAQLREADVVQQEHEHVGRARLRARGLRPRRLRFARRAADGAGERRAFRVGLQFLHGASCVGRGGSRRAASGTTRAGPISS